MIEPVVVVYYSTTHVFRIEEACQASDIRGGSGGVAWGRRVVLRPDSCSFRDPGG